jgi:chromate transporter
MATDRDAGDRAAVGGPTLGTLCRYFLYLGSLGFGGPVALVGYMQRDLVDGRRWFSRDDFMKGLALSQLAPGPLAAQLAICLGYVHSRVGGATLVGLAFVLPSYLMTVGLGMLYVRFGGLAWMQAAFYGVGAAVIGIVVRAAYRLARLTVDRGDRLLWAIVAAMAAVTAWTEAEDGTLFLLCGVVTLLVEAPPAWLARFRRAGSTLPAVLPGVLAGLSGSGGAASGATLAAVLWFFVKAGAFVFGSGLAIVPFLYGGVVQQHRWLDDQQFLDAVAVAMITPGPVVITVAFIGYLVAGQLGALLAAVGVFLPVYLFVVVPYPWFDRWSGNPQIKAFVRGVTAAASGAIAGACVVLARRAVVDVPTLALALGTLGLLTRVRVPEPVVILAAAALGLAVSFWGRP